MTETTWLDATGQAELVRRGEVSPALAPGRTKPYGLVSVVPSMKIGFGLVGSSLRVDPAAKLGGFNCIRSNVLLVRKVS